MRNYQKQVLAAINELIDERIKNGQNYDKLAELHANTLKQSLKMPHQRMKNKKMISTTTQRLRYKD